MTARSLQAPEQCACLYCLCESVCVTESEFGHSFLLCFSTGPNSTFFFTFFNTDQNKNSLFSLCGGWLFRMHGRSFCPNCNSYILWENPSDCWVEKHNCISGRDTWLKLVACGSILYWKTCGQIWSGWFRTISETVLAMWEKKTYHDNWKTFTQYWYKACHRFYKYHFAGILWNKEELFHYCVKDFRSYSRGNNRQYTEYWYSVWQSLHFWHRQPFCWACSIFIRSTCALSGISSICITCNNKDRWGLT